METSQFLAQLLGTLYIIVGISMHLQPQRYKKIIHDIMENEAFLVFGGTAAFVVGFTIITFHNIWIQDWTVIITLVGWIALLKGVALLLAPDMLVTQAKKVTKNLGAYATVVVILGAVLCYFGFIAS